MIRFLHTADWHPGIKYTKLGHSAEKTREVRIKTTRKLVKIANNNVDFIIIAGDFFDNNDVDRRLINIAIEIMGEAAPVPVYILPGNHDPLTKDSPYLNPEWDSLSNTFILKNNQPVEISGIKVTLYPCLVTQKQTRRDPTEWIKVTNNNVSVGIAHGNLQIPGWVNDPNFLIDPERAEKSGLDYLALGEWHSLFKYKGKDNGFRVVYPGTPETTKFGEKNSGKVVIVGTKSMGQNLLEKLINDKWERIAEGDNADKKVIELVGGKLSIRGDTKHEFWGLGQVLWMVQGQPFISEDISRLHRALRILEERANDLQIIVVTCDVDKYNWLTNANFISMEKIC
ncbi:DNA repair exonuclease [Candidatus Aerophobetes bacterium]|nr:DNA repair exonuclease [Candidatus Aerophobetes bacterium]